MNVEKSKVVSVHSIRNFKYLGFALGKGKNTYHNRKFRDAAEAHGLIVDHHEKYGWTITSPSDELLEVILKYELSDILINRNEFGGFQIETAENSV